MTVAPAVEDRRLTPPARLRRNSDIRRVLRRRGRVRGRCVDVHIRDSGTSSPPRFTVVAGRGVGPSVDRNRAKRRIRAAVRETGMPAGRDAVLVARPRAVDAPIEMIRREVRPVGEPAERLKGAPGG